MKKYLLMMVAMLGMATSSTWAQGVGALSFMTHAWDDTQKKVTTTFEDLYEGTYSELSGNHSDDWVALGKDSKFAVTGNATYKVLNITGQNAHLYLCDGVTLNVKHIKLEKGYSLHIHAQSSGDSNYGKLIVNNDEFEGAAGIGGGNEADAGDLYIHGGEIKAKGYKGGACIGGGKLGNGGTVYIYDGDVYASIALEGAGIGGGKEGKGGDVYIHGGKVYAYGGSAASGIGGGKYADGANVTITGGTVYAFAGGLAYGIGSGWGCDTNNAKTSITGGTVYAGAENNSYGIPISGTLTIPENFKVNTGRSYEVLDDTPVNYKEILSTSLNGNSPKCVKIELCENHHYVDYICDYCGSEYYVTATSTWSDDGIRATAFSTIDETNKTITITNEAELGLLEYNISHNGGNDYKGHTILLNKDLDMSAHKWAAGSGTFKGTFDGQGHTISGLNYPKDNLNDAGLFAHNDGTIKNVKIANSIIIGNRYVGAIAGNNTGTVENCYVGADVSVYRSDKEDPTKSWGCGGIVGLQTQSPFDSSVTAVIRGCYSEASVNATDKVGGIVGQLKNSQLTDCVSKATINCNSSDGNKGILIGLVVEGAELENNGYISETVLDNANGTRLISVKPSDELVTAGYIIDYDGTASATYNVSGIMHYFLPQLNVGGKWYAKEGDEFTFALVASQDDINLGIVTVNGTVLDPLNSSYTFNANDGAKEYLVEAITWKGQGVADNPYLIQTTADWNSICRALTISSEEECLSGKYFKQTADIDISQGVGVTGEVNFKTFCGTYDGDGHRLNCILTNPVNGSTEAVAPFHRAKDATIKNLYITGNISGGIHSAGIVAFTHGTVNIDNCRVSADITCTGSVTSDAHGGGFVGHAEESNLTIKNGLFEGKLTAIGNGKGDIRLAAFSGWRGNTVDIQYCTENGTYQGTTNDQTAFCWKDNGITTPDNDHLNIYFSDLGHHEGALKALSVTSGTKDLELTFPDDCYNWKDVYHGAMFRSIDENAISYLVGGVFYTIQNSVVRFDVNYPSASWTDVSIYNGETKLSETSGYYSFTQSTKNTVITAKYQADSMDEGIKYIDRTWDEATQKIVETEVTATNAVNLATLIADGNNYIKPVYRDVSFDPQILGENVDYGVDISNRTVYITGTMYLSNFTLYAGQGGGATKLIICDGAVAHIHHIIVNGELRIYGQKNETGELLVNEACTTNGRIEDRHDDRQGDVGIGGSGLYGGAQIYIHSGKVTAHGSGKAPAIGNQVGPQWGRVWIYGGTVVANGSVERANGIGGANSIRIYGGKVTARGGNEAAGIGGDYEQKVQIFGGTVHAYGGEDAAGIGGDRGRYYPGYIGAVTHGGASVEISGGTVYAYGGEDAAGIGTGRATTDYSHRDTVTISGGTVEAYGGKYAAGIGGGINNNGGTINISGGTIHAYGGVDAAGIGGGEDGNSGDITISGGRIYAESTGENSNAVGIGAGEDGTGNTIKILGGTVAAKGGSGNAFAIGSNLSGESNGVLTFADIMKVEAGSSEDNIERRFTAFEREGACWYRKYALVEECHHDMPERGSDKTEALSYTIAEEGHDIHCRYCNFSRNESHVFLTETAGEPCQKCGKKFNAADDLWTITIYQANTSNNDLAYDGDYDGGTQYHLVKGQSFNMPALTNTLEGLSVKALVKDPETAPSNIWLTDAEMAATSGFFDPSQPFTPTQDTKIYARYRLDFTTNWKWNEDEYGFIDPNNVEMWFSNPLLYEQSIRPTIEVKEDKWKDDITYTATVTYPYQYPDGFSGVTYTFTEVKHTPYYGKFLTLIDNEKNNGTIGKYHGKRVEATIKGRTFYHNDTWSPICLPFALSAEQLADEECPLHGATIKELTDVVFADGKLTLTFSGDLSATEAGKPYFVKWSGGADVTDPVFKDVTIDSEIKQPLMILKNKDGETLKEGGDLSYGMVLWGSYDPTVINESIVESKQILYFDADNKLNYPTEPTTINSFRAYLLVYGITADDLEDGAESIIINIGEDTTGISPVTAYGLQPTDEIYTLDGRKMANGNLSKGIYIINGKKVVIR